MGQFFRVVNVKSKAWVSLAPNEKMLEHCYQDNDGVLVVDTLLRKKAICFCRMKIARTRMPRNQQIFTTMLTDMGYSFRLHPKAITPHPVAMYSIMTRNSL